MLSLESRWTLRLLEQFERKTMRRQLFFVKFSKALKQKPLFDLKLFSFFSICPVNLKQRCTLLPIVWDKQVLYVDACTQRRTCPGCPNGLELMRKGHESSTCRAEEKPVLDSGANMWLSSMLYSHLLIQISLCKKMLKEFQREWHKIKLSDKILRSVKKHSNSINYLSS